VHLHMHRIGIRAIHFFQNKKGLMKSKQHKTLESKQIFIIAFYKPGVKIAGQRVKESKHQKIKLQNF